MCLRDGLSFAPDWKSIRAVLQKSYPLRPSKAPPMTLSLGAQPDLFPSDGTSPSARVRDLTDHHRT